MSEWARAATPDARALVQASGPLRKGDRVIVQLRANWTFEGRFHTLKGFHTLKDGAVRIFDPAVRDVLKLDAEDIAVIRKAKDAS